MPGSPSSSAPQRRSTIPTRVPTATIQCLGASRTVTGSKFLLETAGRRLLVDCGLYQGLKDLRLRNWDKLPVDPARIDAVALTHAHIDHIGYLPRLVKDGFGGTDHRHPRDRGSRADHAPGLGPPPGGGGRVPQQTGDVQAHARAAALHRGGRRPAPPSREGHRLPEADAAAARTSRRRSGAPATSSARRRSTSSSRPARLPGASSSRETSAATRRRSSSIRSRSTRPTTSSSSRPTATGCTTPRRFPTSSSASSGPRWTGAAPSSCPPSRSAAPRS